MSLDFATTLWLSFQLFVDCMTTLDFYLDLHTPPEVPFLCFESPPDFSSLYAHAVTSLHQTVEIVLILLSTSGDRSVIERIKQQCLICPRVMKFYLGIQT